MRKMPTPLGPFILILIALIVSVSPGSAYLEYGGAHRLSGSLPVESSTPFTGAGLVYLPLVFDKSALFGDLSGPRINAPFFNDSIHYEEMSIAWFGRVAAPENYADIRTGYNSVELIIDLAIFDRYLWYDTTPSRSTLTDWDAVSLYIHTAGNRGRSPDPSAYRFDAQLNWGTGEPREDFQAAYRGNGSSWSIASIPFSTSTSWRGDAPNNSYDDRGWSASFHIPFASLGFSSPPAQGNIWGLALVLHDRDDSTGNSIPDKTWPEAVTGDIPETWGQLRFGIPVYEAPPATPGGTVVIREGENGAVVPNAAVGGTIGNLCPGNANFIWNEWGNANFAGAESFNIQNQKDVSDWPCFAKYYVQFPLDLVPQGKIIRSARLVLHIWGGSDPTLARSTFLQILEIDQDWQEASLTWNNAPFALQNIAGTWVNPQTENPPDWPGVPYEWDVSLAVERAYIHGLPVRLAVYSADRYQHSGKYFSASETGEWNKVARPTLIIEWGNP